MRSSEAFSSYLLQELKKETRPITLMEVCGTHTMAIAKSGLRALLPSNFTLLSGPGCPVCVTSQGDIDAVIELAKIPGVILTTFGDMMRVPGTKSSLEREKGRGADIRVVYSPLEAVKIAEANQDKQVVFLGVGFETTAPGVGLSIEEAAQKGLENYFVWSLHKLVPPALKAILSDEEVKLDGLICPGHVSAVIGIEPYQELAERYRCPCVVTGFELQDILEGIYLLVEQIKNGQARAEIQYRRVVKPQGNLEAKKVIDRVFCQVDAIWRGLGTIPKSGLEVAGPYEQFNARKRFDVPFLAEEEVKGCSCGEVLKGKKRPFECPLFGVSCTPFRPFGPCMVSSEGACAAYYRYSGKI